MSTITLYQLGDNITARIFPRLTDDDRGNGPERAVRVRFQFPGLRHGVTREWTATITESDLLAFNNAVLDVFYPNDNPPASATEAVLNEVAK